MDDLKERIIFFAIENKRKLLAAISCLAGVFILIVYSQTMPEPAEYGNAEALVAKWEKSGDDASYLEMRKALKKVPSLEKKYGAVIAQKLFQKNKLVDALALARVSLQGIEGDAPFHATYGETTLLIEQGAFQNALERSVGLKENMLHECELVEQIGLQPASGSLLFVHNLLRIACLQKELKNRPGEKAAWEELERFIQEKEALSQLIFGNFREKGLDLSHYIAERKKQL